MSKVTMKRKNKTMKLLKLTRENLTKYMCIIYVYKYMYTHTIQKPQVATYYYTYL